MTVTRRELILSINKYENKKLLFITTNIVIKKKEVGLKAGVSNSNFLEGQRKNTLRTAVYYRKKNLYLAAIYKKSATNKLNLDKIDNFVSFWDVCGPNK